MPITPHKSSLPCTVTSVDGSVLSSTPPTFANVKYPSSVIDVTINPISSQCASIINLGALGLLLRFTAITLPKESIFTSSQYFLNISAIWSVKRYSNPDIPRISLNFLISFLILIQLIYYFLE